MENKEQPFAGLDCFVPRKDEEQGLRGSGLLRASQRRGAGLYGTGLLHDVRKDEERGSEGLDCFVPRKDEQGLR